MKKRHNTRFFQHDGKQITNVQAGTVIDQTIIHPYQFDFYLCSQAAMYVTFTFLLRNSIIYCCRMGTSRPALYHVLYDDIGFSSDEIQQLTYWVSWYLRTIVRIYICSIVVMSYGYALYQICFDSSSCTLCSSSSLRITSTSVWRR